MRYHPPLIWNRECSFRLLERMLEDLSVFRSCSCSGKARRGLRSRMGHGAGCTILDFGATASVGRVSRAGRVSFQPAGHGIVERDRWRYFLYFSAFPCCAGVFWPAIARDSLRQSE